METKQQIIQKAFALFMTRGYKEVTMSTLLKETGVSKGGFYHYFQSKEELFEAVVEQFFFGVASSDGFTPSSEKSFMENMHDFLNQKEEAFHVFASQLGVEHSEINFFLFIMQAIQYLPGVRQKVTLYMYRERRQLERIIELATERGEIRPEINKSALAAMLITAFDGVEMHGVLLSQSFETHRRELDMIQQVYQWIKK